jgi:hypothetical protein
LGFKKIWGYRVSDLKNIAGILASTVLLMEFDGICCGQLSNFDGSSISGTTGNLRRESRTNDGLMAVLSSTHMQASVASQLLPSECSV